MRRALVLPFLLLTAWPAAAQDLELPCPDTLGLRQQFLDGEVEEVYSVWQNYFKTAQQTRSRVGHGCFASGSKMMGILNLRLPSKRDTNQALIDLYMVLKLTPRAEMWDLWLPLETQAYWDAFREENAPPRTAEEIWQDRWLPPVSYEPTKDPEALSLRKAYHRNRLLYANARDDEENFFKIIENIGPLRDPSFTLLRTDVMIRLGLNVTQSKRELLKFEGQKSKVMSEGDLVGWHGRLALMVKEREKSVEKEDSTRPEPQPKLQSRLKLSQGPKK